jgi:hypothetical protein
MEQLVRDVRITEIYEGTNTIQALDLVGRKLGIGGGRLVTGWLKEVELTLSAAKGNTDMAEFVGPFVQALARLNAATQWLVALDAGDPNGRAAAANEYLRLFTLTAMGWMWVRMAMVALAKRGSNDPFYETKLAVGRYFMARVLPQTVGIDAVMRSGSVPIMALPEAAF